MILNFGKLLKRNSVPNKRTMRGTCYYVEEVDGLRGSRLTNFMYDGMIVAMTVVLRTVMAVLC